jgi:hypothetical protein
MEKTFRSDLSNQTFKFRNDRKILQQAQCSPCMSNNFTYKKSQKRAYFNNWLGIDQSASLKIVCAHIRYAKQAKQKRMDISDMQIHTNTNRLDQICNTIQYNTNRSDGSDMRMRNMLVPEIPKPKQVETTLNTSDLWQCHTEFNRVKIGWTKSYLCACNCIFSFVADMRCLRATTA